MLAFFFLLFLNGVVGIGVWCAYRKIIGHMRRDSQAAELIAKHVIAPLLTGKEPEEKSP